MERDITIAGAKIKLFEAGEGRALLFLHGGEGFRASDSYVDMLTKRFRVFAPTHPGFGLSSLPDWIDAPDDIAHIYLELMDQLKLTQVDIVACSIGGWIAAEIASKVPERVRRLVLVGPVGVKVGSRDRLDIPDIFALPPKRVEALLYHDPTRSVPKPDTLSEADRRAMLQNRETLALLAWEPYMHNPKLKHRLHRMSAPTLFIRGASDGLVSAEYLAGYAALLPNTQTETVDAAGHMPHLEQPETFARSVIKFLEN
jgi:pimeloyl-ACP methyl ester carboxylesterase